MRQPDNIQWFPGHMAKTRRLIRTNLSLVDVVLELRDARIVKSSENPEIESLVRNKPRIVLLNKADLADEAVTRLWLKWFEQRNIPALGIDCASGRGIAKIHSAVREASKERIERMERRGMSGKRLRAMILGVPNVGKSTLINRLASSRKTKVEDRPGVTREPQWVSTKSGMELLDMPGVLWPKFKDPVTGLHLALTGAIRDDVVDVESLAQALLKILSGLYPKALMQRYNLENLELESQKEHELLETIARRRKMLLPMEKPDLLRASVMLLDEFRGCKIGRISLERPNITERRL
jgi:ribosome biogenesis GTPase A